MRIASLVAAVVGVVAFRPTFAADPPRAVDPDIVLSAKVSAAVAADPGLGGLNLTVDVVNRAVEIGGPVASADLIPKIEAAARTVPGLLSVKVTAWVPATDDTFARLVDKEMKWRPATQPAPDAGRPVASPIVLLPRVEPAAPTPALSRPPRELPPPVVSAAFGPVTVQRVPVLAGGFLQDPVGPNGVPVSPLPMPAPAGDPAAPAYTAIPPPAVPALPVGLLSGIDRAIERVRVGDPRFARLTVERQSGAAVITGSAGRVADAWDLAAALRRVPGVERVVVGPVSGR